MTDSNEFKNVQKFLDTVQYNKNGLQRYEWIFGQGFLSTGGLDTTQAVLSRVTNLGPGSRVLDIGSGCGGHAILMAETFGCHVHGIDLSKNMMATALEHLNAKPHLKTLITFEIKDCTSCDLNHNYYDVIYSRDAIMHIDNKRDLFANMIKWLKPGGVFIVTDYVRGEKEEDYTNEFVHYLQERQYHLSTPTEYQDLLVNSGFVDVKIENWNERFKLSLEKELFLLRSKRDQFLQKFSLQDFHDLQNGWFTKIDRVNLGIQGWILGYARKPRLG